MRPSNIVVVCDHATNIVPPSTGMGSLDLSDADMGRHIAYDIGAAGLSRALAQLMEAPVILSQFSRLVIDPNRDEDDPTLVMRLYDGSLIPGNRNVTSAEIDRRLEAFHRPYHRAIAKLATARPNPVLVSIHSFTPQLSGRRVRPWQIGVLSAVDRRVADPLLRRLRAERDLCVGDNEPYSGDLAGDTMDRHGVGPGRPHVLLEVRNDLISTPTDQRHWAERLAPHIAAVVEPFVLQKTGS